MLPKIFTYNTYLSRMSKGPKSRSSIASKFCTGPLPKFLVSSDNPLGRIPKDFTSFVKYRVDKQTIKIISFILNVVRMMFKLQTFCDRVQTKVSVLSYLHFYSIYRDYCELNESKWLSKYRKVASRSTSRLVTPPCY